MVRVVDRLAAAIEEAARMLDEASEAARDLAQRLDWAADGLRDVADRIAEVKAPAREAEELERYLEEALEAGNLYDTVTWVRRALELVNPHHPGVQP